MHKVGTSQLLQRCIAALVLAVTVPSVAASVTLPNQSKDKWRWFEIEVLVFKHSPTETVAEQFPWQGPSSFTDAAYNPLVDYYVPEITGALAGLPRCAPPSLDESFSTAALWCVQPAELDPLLPQNWQRRERMLASLARAPAQVIDGLGGDVTKAKLPYIAPAEQFELAEMRQQITRRGVGTPLLHMSWYQPVFGLEDGFKVRLFGGQNYGERFAPSGYLYSNDDHELTPNELAQRLELLLAQQQDTQLQFSARSEDQPLAPPPFLIREADAPAVWELDGTLHVYLVGNYLHIASDLELREPHAVNWQPAALAAQAERALQPRSDGEFLRSFKLEQLRRVISHETHYFDHPKLGIAVQIRRTDLSARRY
ncbi:peptidoglycan binding protein CsiV [Pseudidiomarina homiensis]|uniref:peptidoglycan binding protein CsiV n=1 Tax=Pseudidiomarina homiensis TaxID=364198 RepID=UPI00215A1C6A|nr:peptidoglycan binding protein CsiV [Pseudidiomarina homiensis]